MRKSWMVVSILVLLVFIAVVPPVVFAQTSGGACPGAPLPRLRAGMTARPAQVFNTLWASPASSIPITVLYRSTGDTYTIVSGPTCEGGPYNWYQVNYRGTTGWITEGTGNTYWSEPVSTTPVTVTVPVTATPRPVVTPAPNPAGCPGAPAPRLRIGGNGRVAQVYSSLRAALDSNVVTLVMYRANNDTFRVLNGPFCGTNPHNWWQVEYKGIVGWVTEGYAGAYWVEPV